MERLYSSLFFFCVYEDPLAQKVALTTLYKLVSSFSFPDLLWDKMVVTVLQVNCGILNLSYNARLRL